MITLLKLCEAESIMEDTSKYWTLVRLNGFGGYRVDELAIARAYFSPLAENFPEAAKNLILTQLFPKYQSRDATAELCLRCFISHCILQECQSLVRQFGSYYHFNVSDLLPYVLDDDGLAIKNYVPLTYQILQSFNPATSSLVTWTIRLVRQNAELNRFFMEQGIYLISDWAILNDTKPQKLRRVLIEFYQWAVAPSEQAASILESYRSVYLSDRVTQGAKGKCPNPTSEQLQRIAGDLQTKLNQTLSPETIFNQLQQIAKKLRQYRLERYRSSAQSIDIPEVARAAEQQLTGESDTDIAEQFLQAYRPQFLICLDAALEKVVSDRLNTCKNTTKAAQFRTALQLFHCQRLSMTAIAEHLNLPRQDSVTRLLKVKDLRVDVRLHMLPCLKTYVLEVAQEYTPTRLIGFEQQLEAALDEQIESLIVDEARQYQARNHISGSLFSERLCAYLDRTETTIIKNV
jgi:hypothetical protein